jgi:type I restriction enzyme R subunit
MPTPEALARQTIDQKLTAAGWIVQDFKALNLGAGQGVAVREFQTSSGSRGSLRGRCWDPLFKGG